MYSKIYSYLMTQRMDVWNPILKPYLLSIFMCITISMMMTTALATSQIYIYNFSLNLIFKTLGFCSISMQTKYIVRDMYRAQISIQNRTISIYSRLKFIASGNLLLKVKIRGAEKMTYSFYAIEQQSSLLFVSKEFRAKI